MVYLHILGSGETTSAKANSKGHLFEKLMLDLCEHLKMSVTSVNKREAGKEIDIEGEIVIGKVPFFAECKAKKTPLDSPDIQQFGYKFLIKHKRNPDMRGLIFTLSPLNSGAQELWDDELTAEYGKKVDCYLHDQIVELLIKHYDLFTPEFVRKAAEERSGRRCGDTQLLCVEGNNQSANLFWAQLLMSSDGTEPNAVVFYTSDGDFVTEKATIDRLQNLKPDLSTRKLVCLNTSSLPSMLDDISPARRVVRVRMSSEWFDYRFPSAPRFFVGREFQLRELYSFLDDVSQGKTTSRGMLVTGKSGIGKSSLALKARKELQPKKIVFVPIDSRLCDDVSFLFDCVNELLFELRRIPEIEEELQTVRVRGLDSLVDTLTNIHQTLERYGYLSVLFFDQFEKVFEYPEVTKAVRNLFFSINEKHLSVLFGFAWKSDLWSLAEGFPHYERDDIARESRILRQLSEFGPEETDEILKELENQWGSKLNIQLRRQITTFSRGLPWLLKKVGAHILEQKERGVTEEELIETNLKLQDLFESDLDGLDEEEKALLKAIAPLLPATLQRLSESFEISNIDQSLHQFINRRILVKITEDVGSSLANVKYDAYSDIFREFLITGIVPIQEAYYFYTYPRGALNFFEKVREREELSIEQEMEETGKQVGSIYNLSRDLRSVGLITMRNKVFRTTEEISNLESDEMPQYLQSQLKQNRLISRCLAELNEKEVLSLPDVVKILRELFPSVQEFKESTREYYSKTTAWWLHHTRLAFYDRKDKSLHRMDDEAAFESVVGGRRAPQAGFRFPLCFRNAVIECLEILQKLGGKTSFEQLVGSLSKSHQSIEKVISDNLNLGFVGYDSENALYFLTPLGRRFITSPEKTRRRLFGEQGSNLQVFDQFVSYVKSSGRKGITSKDAANYLVQEMELELADSTIDKLGNILANWAEYGGIIARVNRLCLMKDLVPEQITLF